MLALAVAVVAVGITMVSGRFGNAVASAAPSGHVTILVVAGQSNATGWESYDVASGSHANLVTATATWADLHDRIAWAQPDTSQPDVGLGASGPVPLDSSQFEKPNALVPKGADVFGPEISLARAVTAAGTGAVVVVKVTEGGTTLADAGSVWNPRRGRMFGDIVAAVRTVEDHERQSYAAVDLGGLFWVQGESDALVPADATAYRAALATFIARIRTDLAAPHLPVVLAEESVTDYIDFQRFAAICSAPTCASYAAGNHQVRSADQWAAAHLSRVYRVDTSDLARASIGIHLTDRAELALGTELAATWLAATRH